MIDAQKGFMKDGNTPEGFCGVDDRFAAEVWYTNFSYTAAPSGVMV
jgi:hypothetical protein